MLAGQATRVRTLIVDDDEKGRRVIRNLLTQDEEVEVVGEAMSASEARERIAELRPDLVFMDIEMPGGSGLDLLRQLEEPVPYVIFATAHPEHALPAFDLQAVDFLVKPVQRLRFNGSMARVKKRIVEQRVAGLAMEFANAANEISSKPAGPRAAAYAETMTIRVRRRLVALALDDIAWIEGAGQYSRVHAKGGEYLLSRSLVSLECELDPRRFFRIHRSAIVNAAHVREVRSCGDGRYNICLDGGLSLPLGRARREAMQSLLYGICAREA